MAETRGPGTARGRFSRRRFLVGGAGFTAAALLGSGSLRGRDQSGNRPVAALGSASRPGGPPGPPGAPQALSVDGLTVPIGLSPADVQFAWQVGDLRRGATQSAYRVVVQKESLTASGQSSYSPSLSPTVWDSGKVHSDRQAFVAYNGPPLAPDSSYRWTVQTWAGSGNPGPFATPGTFETGLQDEDWQAMWVWLPVDTATRPDQWAYVRKTFPLGSVPIVRARAYVSADQQYALYVNGAQAGRGQAYSYPDSQYYETLDLTPYLVAGELNAVGLLYSWEGATKGHPAGTPGVIAQISVLHADGSVELVVTDNTWKARVGAWLPGTQRDLEGDNVDYTENIDGQLIPIGWKIAGFDDSGWEPATAIGPAGTAPWTNLVSVRTRLVQQPIAALSLTQLPSGAVVADFGKVYAASPQISFYHGVPGRVINMRAGYLLDEPRPGQTLVGQPGQVSVFHGTQHTDMSYSYVQAGGQEQFAAFDYLGYRYFQIDDPGETLSPSDVVAVTRHTAVPDLQAASFSCSEPTIDAIFQLSVHSALFTAQEQFIDTPTREKGPWLWDGFNESQTTMVAFAEQNLTRKSLLEFSQSERRFWRKSGAVNKIYPTGLGAGDIDEYTEIYPEWVWQYWLNTGDITVLGAVYPTLAEVANYVDRSIDSSTGLVTQLPSTEPVSIAYPVLTRINVLGANVFGRVADAANALGRPTEEITRQRSRQQRVIDALNGSLVRGDGLYVDGLQSDGSLGGTASQDANACALAYEVVPKNKYALVAAHVASLGMAVEPWTATEVLRALARAGRVDDVVRILLDSRINGWANILSRGATFTWEVWQPSDANGDSMSHGWGSNVLVEIIRLLLGVRPTGPGYGTFSVIPPMTALDWANGAVPTPRGPIIVSWERVPSSAGFSLDVDVPANAAATVHIPAARRGSLTESGRRVEHADGVTVLDTEPPWAVVRIGSGSYRFVYSARRR